MTIPEPAIPAFRAIDVIRKKRDGHELSRAEIDYLVAATRSDEIPDYQISAWLMAALLRGLTRAETAALTDAMLHSGEVLDLSEFPAAKIDKHSTGGVGDKTSLVLAPLVAAAGLYVPMISGRGLGHTGGTLDKLESIPGFNVDLSLGRFREVLRACGCAMIGQTAEIAPADRLFYSLRDVTGTVESPFLICASIMSKKLAEGIDGLVLDVKTGSGAFMKTEEDAAFLAELMVETGQRMGKKVVALITDMDQPLGLRVGNALEVEEVIEVLHGAGPEDLRELCLELAAWMLHLGGAPRNVHDAKKLAAELIRSGQALEKFRADRRAAGRRCRLRSMIHRGCRARNLTRRDESRERLRHRDPVRGCGHGLRRSRRRPREKGRFGRPGGGNHPAQESRRPSRGGRDPLHRNVQLRTSRARAKALLEQSYQIADSAAAPRKLIQRIIPDTQQS